MNRTDLVQALEEKLTGSPLFIVEVDVQPTNRVKVLIDGDEGGRELLDRAFEVGKLDLVAELAAQVDRLLLHAVSDK